MRAMAKLAKRHPHLKGEALERFVQFARENRGTPAAVFRGKLGAIQALQSLDDLAAVSALREMALKEADGRLKRRAEDAITALIESSKKPEEMREIRTRLDDLMDENKSLRDRMELLEKKSQATDKRKKGTK